MRGEFIDIGGRRLRTVRSGPERGRPLIFCEHGAHGCAADWAVVQDQLAARGLKSLAYDRAGMGFSDAGPAPRDAAAIVADAVRLLDHLDERAPVVLCGHSMGGLMIRAFALAHPERVVGLVLVDAMTPDIIGLPGGARAIKGFARLLDFASAGSKFGLMAPLAPFSAGLIGLSGDAAAEKRRIYGAPAHVRGSAAEVNQWPASSSIAGAAPLPPDLPVAVVTAGAYRQPNPVKRMQEVPARQSSRGHVEHVAGSNHANLLGPRHAGAILRGVEHVLTAAGLGALALDQA